MFDVDDFVARCRSAATGSEPRLAIRELLHEALADRAQVAGALPVTLAELVPLHSGPDVAIFKVVWAPGMTFPPHDHLTWACTGIYGGREHNTLYRLVDGAPVPSGELVLEAGDVGLLGDDAVHAVANPRSHEYSAAIHVYGGDFVTLLRSNWIGDPPERVPASVELSRAMFDAANATAGRGGSPG